MPSVSLRQKYLMARAAHDPKFAKSIGLDPDVAKEWHEADKHRSPEEEKRAFAAHAKQKAKEKK